MRKAMTSLQNLRLLGRSAGLLSRGVREKGKKCNEYGVERKPMSVKCRL
jgi:hypothetical protein